MLDIGWSELMVIALVAIVVFPSKDLPKLLRTVGQTVGKVRRMAGDFQSQFNAALREAEREADLLDTKKELEQLKSLNPANQIKDALNPLKAVGDDIKRSIDSSAPTTTPTPAVPTPAAPAPAAAIAAAAAPPAVAPTPPTEVTAPAPTAPNPVPTTPPSTSGASEGSSR